MCEAAVFQARRRGRADLAEAWLEDVPAATAIPGNREHAEAAILEARGDREGARRCGRSCETLRLAIAATFPRRNHGASPEAHASTHAISSAVNDA